LAWAGHQIHVAIPINKMLDAGVPADQVPLPHEFILKPALMKEMFPSVDWGIFSGLMPFFTLDWGKYAEFLTFKGGLDPQNGALWLTDQAHHHLAIAVLFIVAGHMYRTNRGCHANDWGQRVRAVWQSYPG
jgi:photosystem I P700 chlorophyll a apoprotein A1